MKYASRIYLAIIFGILYIPIFTLILFSFNSQNSTAVLDGLSFRWYIELFNSAEAFIALRNTLILAVLSSLLATVIGTAAAEGVYRMKSKLARESVKSVTNIPMMNPDIVTGMSMMLFFAAVMAIFKISNYNDIGFFAMLIAHTTFCLPYVFLSVLPRINELGNTMSEAALDLGCTPIQAFFKVKLPNIMPAVISGMVMAFTLSLDDFVISYFVGPTNFQTLPLLIYSMTKKKVTPDMYALSAIIIVTIFLLLIVSNMRSDKKDSGASDRKKQRIRLIIIIAAVVLIIGLIIFSFIDRNKAEDESGAPISNDVITLNVYNWGEYISDGFEGAYDTNLEFEKYCREVLKLNVKVNYSNYNNNEDMYSKLKNSAISYDIVIPSDYMIQKMIEEDMLLEFNVAEDIENYKYIDEDFKNRYYDPQNKYSVPYTYGMIGIIYNKELVAEEDVKDESWDLLWNEKYSGKILQFNNPRDAFATAMYLGGLDVNSDDTDVWNEALEMLKEQKPLLQGYVNDEIFNKMTTASAAIAPYYVGDYITMATTEGAPELGFYYPGEGANYFVDAMCIPKNATNPELAKAYINFMLSEEPAIANALYIGYASPNTLVSTSEEYAEEMGEFSMELLYGTTPIEANEKYNALFGGNPDASCYESFSPKIQSHVNTLWENLKLENSTELWIHIATVIIVGGVLTLCIYTIYVKKKRSKAYRMRDKALRAAKKNASN